MRSRRERIAPADAGLPVTGRRRTPGLRREELALLAGISATWLTYLEQGRDVRPSGQVRDALARALRLTGAEQEHLRRLAGGGAKPEKDAPEEAASEVAAVPALLGDNPAYVTGICYDILATNDAAAELFRGIESGGNVVRWMFTEPAAREVLVDCRAAQTPLPEANLQLSCHRSSPAAESGSTSSDPAAYRSTYQRREQPPDATMIIGPHRCRRPPQPLITSL